MDTNKLEKAQRMATEIVKALQLIKERLTELGSFSLEKEG